VSRIDQISELNYERGSSPFGKIAVGRLIYALRVGLSG
jgi:hypothetical protein